jgi:hypothetical protein
MRRVLHIITEEAEPLAQAILQRQREQPQCQVEVVDLAQQDPNYHELLEKIFAADSVQMW